MTPSIIERLVYLLVIVLSLIVVALVATSPSFLMGTTAVYQGF
jgi:hypothetical protein